MASSPNEGELVAQFRQQFESVEALEQSLEKAKAALEATKQSLLDLFEENGTERTATYEGVGWITRCKPRLYANCTEEKKPELFDILRKEGREDMIKEVVNPSTLSSYVSGLVEEGKPVPGCIGYVFKPAVRLYTKE